MNANCHRRLPVSRMFRLFLTCQMIAVLLIVSGEVKAAGNNPAGTTENSLSALVCKDLYCTYLPAIRTPDPCLVGNTITDPMNDVTPAYIDVTSLSTGYSGTTLTGVFKIRDVPAALTFNRVGVPANFMEYGWIIAVDVDNNRNTGSLHYLEPGADYIVSADHFVYQPNKPVTTPIQNMVQVSTWVYDASFGGYSFSSWATLAIDPNSDIMVLTGTIPGLNGNSRIMFQTSVHNPGGSPTIDTSYCSQAGAGSPQMAEEQERFFRQTAPEGTIERVPGPVQ